MTDLKETPCRVVVGKNGKRMLEIPKVIHGDKFSRIHDVEKGIIVFFTDESSPSKKVKKNG